MSVELDRIFLPDLTISYLHVRLNIGYAKCRVKNITYPKNIFRSERNGNIAHLAR